MMKKKGRKKMSEATILYKKKFRESSAVEKLYKTIYDYKLREEAYKTAIKIYLDLSK